MDGSDFSKGSASVAGTSLYSSDHDALILDIGASYSRFGASGNDKPSFTIPSLVSFCRVDSQPSGSPLPSATSSSSILAQDASASSSSLRSSASSLHDSESKRIKFEYENEKHKFGYEEVFRYSSDKEIATFYETGKVREFNWEIYEELMGYFSRSKISIDNENDIHLNCFKDRSLILTEPVIEDMARSRERIAEIMFEKYEISSIFFSPTAPLSCYANARTTGIVLDLGGGQFTSAPVHDGYMIREDVQQSSLGGNLIDTMVKQTIDKHYVVATSSTQKKHLLLDFECHAIANGKFEAIDPLPKSKASFRRFSHLDLCRRIKETAIFFEEDGIEQNEKTYILPDGTEIVCDKIRKEICDILFNSTISEYNNIVYLPLHALVYEAAQGNEETRADTENSSDFRRTLLENIILCGGMSSIPGLTTKLKKEIRSVAPIGDQPRVIIAPLPQRLFAPWLGGSILGSLSTFSEISVSKNQFKESGASAINLRCP